MKEFVTVAIFNFPHETYILKNLLDNEGISYFFENETLVSIDPFASIAYGGIKLKVHPNDIERTKAILDRFRND
ncbi:MAG: DUF2007 domain-containing protein [Flavobacterium sp.]|nr:DUF2007 domain-containing protein [Flavobacterium sp.]